MDKKYGVVVEKLRQLFQFQARFRKVRMLVRRIDLIVTEESVFGVSNRPHLKLKIPFNNVEEFNIMANLQIKITLNMDRYDYCIVTARSDLQLQEIITLLRECQGRQKWCITDQ
ncbi:hypothetical protein QE152_g16920 [Popillia japonica]|uniref:Uncharacterized protein n=1 Tax=Popillia japonica TaxID=7064 RepID=A0AAW1L3J0_POPJA